MKVKTSSVTITHELYDGSTNEIVITSGQCKDTGPYVSVKDNSGVIWLRPDSWPAVRGGIQEVFSSLEMPSLIPLKGKFIA